MVCPPWCQKDHSGVSAERVTLWEATVPIPKEELGCSLSCRMGPEPEGHLVTLGQCDAGNAEGGVMDVPALQLTPWEDRTPSADTEPWGGPNCSVLLALHPNPLFADSA